MTLPDLLRLMPLLALLLFAGAPRAQTERAPEAASQPAVATPAEPQADPQPGAQANSPATAQATPQPSSQPSEPPVETTLQARNRVLLELGRKPVALNMTIRSFTTGRRLRGEVSFTLSGEEKLEPTDDLTCVPSLTLGCGIVARFSSPGKTGAAPSIFEARLEDGVFWIRDGKKDGKKDGTSDGNQGGNQGRNKAGEQEGNGDGADNEVEAEATRNFENFIVSMIENASVSIKLRVDQKEDFVFDLRRLPWPLADFAPDHPFTARFGSDPVMAALQRKYPARYLKVVQAAREALRESGPLPPEAETRVLEAMHAAIGSLRPMVSDELLEKIVTNADAAARQIGSRDPGLCNALAIAARSPLTTPELRDTPLAKEEHELWRQVVETANPRFIRKVPNNDLTASTPRFEENMRQANASGCGMFAAVIEAILKLPRDERRLWLRATVGTVEDLRPEPAPRRR